MSKFAVTILCLSAIVACNADAPVAAPAPTPAPSAAAAPSPAPAPSAAPAPAADDGAKEKQALEIACVAYQAAKDGAAEGASEADIGKAFHEKATADLEAKGLSMDIGVLGAIAHASAADKVTLLGDAITKHGLTDTCKAMQTDMGANHPEPPKGDAAAAADAPAVAPATN